MLDLPRDRLLSTTDVAHVLGCSRDTVLRAIHRGALRCRDLGVAGRPLLRVHPDDLEAFIDSLPARTEPSTRQRRTAP